MTETTGGPGPQQHDYGETYDPFRAAHPAVLVHDVGLEIFERAWREPDTPCPQCHSGSVAERGTAPLDERRWIRFSCGDFIAVEHTAG